VNRIQRIIRRFLILTNRNKRIFRYEYDGYGKGHYHTIGHNWIIEDSKGIYKGAARASNSQKWKLEEHIAHLEGFYAWWDAPMWAHKSTKRVYIVCNAINNFFRSAYFTMRRLRRTSIVVGMRG
jgi:hypothetical protein